MAKQRVQKSQKPQKPQASNAQGRQKNTQNRQKSFHFEFLNPAQKMAWGAFDQHDVLFLLGPAGCGKALTMDSKLYTRNGPILMRDVKIGDEIADHSGNFSKVTGIFPQGKKQICRVHFSDETQVDCCEDHLWEVSNSDNGWTRVVDTKYIEKNCRRKKDGLKRILSIPCTKPVNFSRQEYVISPYVMGIIIAEGNTTQSQLSFSSSENEVLQRVSQEIDSDYTCKTRFHKKSVDHSIVKTKRGKSYNKYLEELSLLDLRGKYSYEKFIPDKYLYGSVDQRISLLQGLMDGDGGVEKTGAISYCTTSYRLAKDFCNLVYSLGGTTRIRRKEGSLKEDGSRHRVSYRCYINLPNDIEIFFLSRKKRIRQLRTKYLPKKYIDRVERLHEEEMQCITVDNSRHLYLTDSFVVTHNTMLSCAFAISEILAGKKEQIVLTRPIVEAGENLGFLPGDLNEKVSPYMVPMYDSIQKCVGREGQQKEIIENSIRVSPLAFMRGVTFDDSICIFDEAQNATKSQLKLFLTRFGHNSKIIITGDPYQSDLRPGDQGLMHVVKQLEDLPGVGVIYFKASSIVRHPLIASILERLEDRSAE